MRRGYTAHVQPVIPTLLQKKKKKRERSRELRTIERDATSRTKVKGKRVLQLHIQHAPLYPVAVNPGIIPDNFCFSKTSSRGAATLHRVLEA